MSLSHDADEVASCQGRFGAGVPLKPMLAKICEGIPDALRQLKGDFLAEFKYDGMRSQIHLLPNGSVKLFSRNCAFPDALIPVKLRNQPSSLAAADSSPLSSDFCAERHASIWPCTSRACIPNLI